MIRKIILFTVSALLITWFAGAYIIKSNVVLLIKQLQTDNTTLAYEDASISGFPFNWRVKLKHPKITVVDHISSNELLFDSIYISVAFNLKDISINAGKKIDVTRSFDEENISYKLIADKSFLLNIKTFNLLNKSNISKENFEENIKMVDFSSSKVIAEQAEKEIFELKDIKLSILRNFEENLNKLLLKLSGKYTSDSNFLEFKSASIQSQIDYIIEKSTDQENHEVVHLLNFGKVYINLDDAFLGINGKLKLATTKLPEGEFDVEMRKYSKVVDLIIPDDFILSRTYVKKIISKAVMLHADDEALMDKVKFNVEFSDQGVKIGKLDLADLKK